MATKETAKRVFYTGNEVDRPGHPEAPSVVNSSGDPRKTASAEVMAGRQTLKPKARRTGAVKSNFGSLNQQIGNIFAAPETNAFGTTSSQPAMNPNNNPPFPSSQGGTNSTNPFQSSSNNTSSTGLFQQTSSQSFPPSTTPQAGGTSAAPVVSSFPSSTSFGFGSNNTAPSNTSTNTFSFGASNAAPSNPSTNTFSFGASSAAPSNPSSNTFGFGSSNASQNKPQPSGFSFAAPTSGFGFSSGYNDTNPFAEAMGGSVLPVTPKFDRPVDFDKQPSINDLGQKWVEQQQKEKEEKEREAREGTQNPPGNKFAGLQFGAGFNPTIFNPQSSKPTRPSPDYTLGSSGTPATKTNIFASATPSNPGSTQSPFSNPQTMNVDQEAMSSLSTPAQKERPQTTYSGGTAVETFAFNEPASAFGPKRVGPILDIGNKPINTGMTDSARSGGYHENYKAMMEQAKYIKPADPDSDDERDLRKLSAKQRGKLRVDEFDEDRAARRKEKEQRAAQKEQNASASNQPSTPGNQPSATSKRPSSQPKTNTQQLPLPQFSLSSALQSPAPPTSLQQPASPENSRIHQQQQRLPPLPTTFSGLMDSLGPNKPTSTQTSQGASAAGGSYTAPSQTQKPASTPAPQAGSGTSGLFSSKSQPQTPTSKPASKAGSNTVGSFPYKLHWEKPTSTATPQSASAAGGLFSSQPQSQKPTSSPAPRGSLFPSQSQSQRPASSPAPQGSLFPTNSQSQPPSRSSPSFSFTGASEHRGKAKSVDSDTENERLQEEERRARLLSPESEPSNSGQPLDQRSLDIKNAGRHLMAGLSMREDVELEMSSPPHQPPDYEGGNAFEDIYSDTSFGHYPSPAGNPTINEPHSPEAEMTNTPTGGPADEDMLSPPEGSPVLAPQSRSSQQPTTDASSIFATASTSDLRNLQKLANKQSSSSLFGPFIQQAAANLLAQAQAHGQSTQTQSTQAQSTQAQSTQAQSTQAQSTQAQSSQQPLFGASPAFGQQDQQRTPQAQTQTHTQSTSQPIFGASPAFGLPNQTSTPQQLFGTSSAFGQQEQQSTPQPLFGGSPAFGQQAQQSTTTPRSNFSSTQSNAVQFPSAQPSQGRFGFSSNTSSTPAAFGTFNTSNTPSSSVLTGQPVANQSHYPSKRVRTSPPQDSSIGQPIQFAGVADRPSNADTRTQTDETSLETTDTHSNPATLSTKLPSTAEDAQHRASSPTKEPAGDSTSALTFTGAQSTVAVPPTDTAQRETTPSPAPSTELNQVQIDMLQALNASIKRTLSSLDVSGDWSGYLQAFSSQYAIIKAMKRPTLKRRAPALVEESTPRDDNVPSSNLASGSFGAGSGVPAKKLKSSNMGDADADTAGEVSSKATSSTDSVAVPSVLAPVARSEVGSDAAGVAPTNIFAAQFSSASAAPRQAAASPAIDFAKQFAAQAEKDRVSAEKKAKAKRRAEEFDSDEDDEAEWERRDAEAQAAKKAKLSGASGTGFRPQLPASVPTAVNFAEQFSAQAQRDSAASEEEAKARRKAEEFDSDEEDEAEWERKDAEKRAKALEEGVSHSAGGFRYDPSKTATTSTTSAVQESVLSGSPDPISVGSSIFGHLVQARPADDDDDDEDEPSVDVAAPGGPKNPNAGKSLFERITRDGEQLGHGSKDGGPQFSAEGNQNSPSSFSNGASELKSSNRLAAGPSLMPPGDQTWTVGSPIKFGVNHSAPSGLANSAPASKPFTFAGGKLGTLAPPVSSLFSGSSLSRASTPGTDATSGNESGADTGDSIDPADAQVELSDLTSEEKREEEVVYQLPSPGKLLKFVDDLDKDGKSAKKWQVQGSGPVRILRNKETQNIRLLLRASPSGRVILNTRLHSSVNYEKPGAKMVRFTSFEKDGSMMPCIIKTASDEEAVQFQETLQDNKPA